MKFGQQLNKAFTEKTLIRIYTEEPDDDYYDGLIVCLTEGFIVMAQELDYAFEGFVMIPVKHIQGFKQSDVESFSQKLMAFTGDFDRLSVPDWLIQCTDIDDFFAGLMAHNPWVCAAWVCPSCENIHNDVANLQAHEEDSISVTCYDKTGAKMGDMGWSLKKIYSIEFSAPYLIKFAQYMEMNQSTIQ